MRRMALLYVAAWLAVAIVAGPTSAREFVDGAGRRVEVPDKVTRVYPAGGPANVILYVLAPDRLLGWNRPLTPSERAYVPSPGRSRYSWNSCRTPTAASSFPKAAAC